MGIRDLGFMISPNMGNLSPLDKLPWAADNGCFSTGSSFVLSRFYAFLEKLKCYQPTCLFAVAPDVVGDAAATVERSRDVLPVLRSLGWKVAFVAQDGLEHLTPDWDSFDALFIGGSTAWKLSNHSARLCAEAKRRSKWVHMGRVNSAQRMRIACSFGCDSVDGTFLAFGPDKNTPAVLSWLNEVRVIKTLPFWS